MRNTPKSLTLFIKDLNAEFELPTNSYRIHPPDTDGSIRVTLDDETKAKVKAFFEKGKVVAYTPEETRTYTVSLEDGKLKLSAEE